MPCEHRRQPSGQQCVERVLVMEHGDLKVMAGTEGVEPSQRGFGGRLAP